MKKYIFSALALAAVMVSCNNASPKMDEQPAAGEVSATGLKIAFVEVDSLMTQYDFAKDYSVTCRSCRLVLRMNSLLRLPSSTRPFATRSRTSSRITTRTNSLT